MLCQTVSYVLTVSAVLMYDFLIKLHLYILIYFICVLYITFSPVNIRNSLCLCWNVVCKTYEMNLLVYAKIFSLCHKARAHNPCQIHRLVNYRFGFSIIAQKNRMKQIASCVLALKETTLSHDNTAVSYDTEFNGNVIQVVINSKIIYSAFLQMLKTTTGKTVLLKIADSNPSLISKGVIE